MPSLRAALVTPLTGPLALFGRAGAIGLTLWAKHVAHLPAPWTNVVLEVHDSVPDVTTALQAALATHPDVVFGPYGSSPMLTAAAATERVIWNHGGASALLTRPTFPHIVNVLSPATTYFVGVLQAVRAVDASAATVVLVHGATGFGRDIATGVQHAAIDLGFTVETVSFPTQRATSIASRVPAADVLLVAGTFADEQALAPILLVRSWRAVAFVGAGVDEVLSSFEQREGLLGPAQWIASAAPVPDEGPDAQWFVKAYRHETGEEPAYPAAQACAAGLLCARSLRECGTSDDATLLVATRQLVCSTFYGKFRLDPTSGLQVGHQVLLVQWQQGVRRVIWPPEYAERPLLYPKSS